MILRRSANHRKLCPPWERLRPTRCNVFGQPANENQIRFRLKKLEAEWDEFLEAQVDIGETNDHEENMEVHREVRTNSEETYFEVWAALVGKAPQKTQTHSAKGPCLYSAFHLESANVHTYERVRWKF